MVSCWPLPVGQKVTVLQCEKRWLLYPFRYSNRSNTFVDFWMDLAGCASLVIRLSSIRIKFKPAAGFLRCFSPNNLYTPSE